MTTTVATKSTTFTLPTNLASVENYIGAMYGNAIGSATMSQVNSDIVSYGGLNNTLNAYYSAAFGSQTTTSIAALIVSNLGIAVGQSGLVAADVTQANLYVTGVLNATASNARGAAVLSIVNLFNGLAGTTGSLANFSAAATAWVNNQASAVQYAGTSTSDAALSSAVTTVAAANAAAAAAALIGKTFTLTSGTDSFSGSSALDTFVATNTSTAAVFTAGDSLIGGGGNDVFSVSQASGTWSQPTGITVSGIPTVNATLVGGGSISTASGSGFTGVTTLGVNSSAGALTITADPTTAVTSTGTSTGNNATTVQGGSSVSITNALSIAGSTITVGSTTAPVGAVNVTSNSELAITTSTTDTTARNSANTSPAGAIAITGGTTVTVTQGTSTTGANRSAVTTDATNFYWVQNGSVTVTGTAATTSVSSTQVAPVAAALAITTATNQAANVLNGIIGVTAAPVIINDAAANSTSAAGTIATVTLNGFGGTTNAINSNALTTLNLSNAATTTNTQTFAGSTITLGTAATLGLTNSLTAGFPTTLTINAGSGSTGVITDNSNKFVTLNVNTTAATSTLAGFTDTAIRTMNVTGNGVLTVSASSSLSSLLTSLSVTGTGALNMDLSGNTGLTAITMGNSGANVITLNTSQSYTGSTGSDRVTITGAPTAAINGNGGTDTIVLNGAATLFTKASMANVTGFSVLGINTQSSGTFNMSNLPTSISSINILGMANSQTSTFTNVIAGTPLTVAPLSNSTTLATTVAVSYATSDFNGMGNSLTLTMASIGATVLTGNATLGSRIGTLTLNDAIGGGLGTLNLTATPTVGGAMSTIDALNDTWLQNLNMTGTSAFTITAVNNIAGTGNISSNNLAISDNNTSTQNSVITTLNAASLSSISYSGSKAFTITTLANDATTGLSISNTNTASTGAGVLTIAGTLASATTLRLTNSVAATFTLSTTSATTVLASTDNSVVQITHALGTANDTITLGNGGTGSSTSTTTSTTNNIVTTGSGADTITVGSGANTINPGTGADTVTFASHSSVDRVVMSNSDSGAFTAPSSNMVSTTAFDVYTGLRAGDQLVLPATTAMNLNGIKVTNLTSSAYTGVSGNEFYFQGTYTAGTQSFVGSSTGTDTLLVLQTAGAGTSNEAIVLVGYVSGTAAGYGATSGVITLA